MDRRQFIKAGAAAAAVAAAAGFPLSAANAPGAARNAGPYSSEQGAATSADILVRFLGTGAADWKGVDKRGELRRWTSALVDNSVLIDLTAGDVEMLPEGCAPECIFYTHSHRDHFDPSTLLKLGVPTVYVGATWLQHARKKFASAAAELSLPVPNIIPLAVGKKAEVCGLTITALPANHSTSLDDEQTLMYLIEKGAVRVLYATDTGGIPVRAARLVGLDAHVKDGKPISGLIMEATMGVDYDEDYRIFTHSSVGTVARTAHVLESTGRLVAPAGQPVYLTHLARTLNGTQSELDATLPKPLRAAYDGLEVIFRPA